MTTTAAPAIDWDAWRAAYDTMSFAEQQAFYDRVFAEFPEQARFSARVLIRLLGHIGRPVAVVELGGWDGRFAAEVLPGALVRLWENHEIARSAAWAPVCTDPRYEAVALNGWYWDSPHTADVFVASHVLEHLKLRDVLATFDATDCHWMYLQAPLEEEATSWTGYRGSHILEVGWGVLTDELVARGFRLLPGLSEPWVRCFERDS